ncbi:MAG: polysaccharide deacetylase family protein [Flavobacteriales bacterium]|nr:polysaccharide deacetylase family protein [Flavobacteriales bacterium]
MLVHIEHPGPRARYAVQHVLGRILGLEVRYVDDLDGFQSATGPKLSYGRQPVAGAYHVPWSGAIDTLPNGDPPVQRVGDRTGLFHVDEAEDVFAGIFHLLSLVDEIRCRERDAHGRTPAEALFTVRSGIADRPWVEEKAMELGDELERRWPGIPRRKGGYMNVVTVDMDNILRYTGRPFGRAIGASVKELVRGEWSALRERWGTRSGRRGDPFLRSVELVDAHRGMIDRTILFFLMRGGTAYDHAAAADHPATREAIVRAAACAEVGVHPSYITRDDQVRMRAEKDALEHIAGRPVRASRQHFLRWRLPTTLRWAIDAGMTEEHSLGFTDRVGFRAGTCTPFPWYDLEQERGTALMLVPFAVMDSALVERKHLGPEEVVRTMQVMNDRVRRVHGHFVSVWHDRYLSGHREFAAWPEVFEQVMAHAAR